MLSRRKLLIALVLIFGLSAAALWFNRDKAPTAPQQNNTNTQELTAEEPAAKAKETKPQPSFDKTKYSLDKPSSLWIIANKNRPLPSDYAPTDLVVPDVRLRLAASHEQMQFRGLAATDLKTMFDVAAKDGVTLVFGSGYRSYSLQKQFYDGYVARDGQAAADRYSARPGTSEHQTGLAFDATSTSQACHLEICFEDTPEGKWLAANAHSYGFTLRYRQGKEAVTGYQYEPWHFRYVGRELANELYKNNLTLEEFFNL